MGTVVSISLYDVAPDRAQTVLKQIEDDIQVISREIVSLNLHFRSLDP